jgi:hypothetical protein
MAWIRVRKSDLTGELIPEGEGVRIQLDFDDGRKPRRRADARLSEVVELVEKSEAVRSRTARRGSEAPQSGTV